MGSLGRDALQTRGWQGWCLKDEDNRSKGTSGTRNSVHSMEVPGGGARSKGPTRESRFQWLLLSPYWG